MTEYRYFNGKKYKLHNRTPSKIIAYDAAKSWRKYGYNARVTKGIKNMQFGLDVKSVYKNTMEH